MKTLLIPSFSHATRVTVAAVALAVAVACGSSPTSPNNPTPTNPSGCVIITGVTTTTFGAAGGSASISVTTPSTCSWTAVSSAAFLAVVQGASGAGDGVVVFNVAANTGAERTVILTITGSPITITQHAQ